MDSSGGELERRFRGRWSNNGERGREKGCQSFDLELPLSGRDTMIHVHVGADVRVPLTRSQELCLFL